MIELDNTVVEAKRCPNCGATFTCGLNAEKACWCAELPHVFTVPDSGKDCLCPQCLTNAIDKTAAADLDAKGNAERAIVEGEDYYWEGEKMVFTGAFLLRRGYCCDSGCRHCPYSRRD